MSAGWMETIFAVIMAGPLLFFGGCTLYLWRLLLSAVAWRRRVLPLALPEVHAAGGPEAMPAGFHERLPRLETYARFALLIPAHNERLLIGAVLDALRNLDYPRDAYRVVVIADNCTDETAAIARQRGATVLERADTERRGKGYALEWAIEQLENAPEFAWDALVVLDADTFVSANLLQAFAEGLRAGHRVMQARYEVLNPGESWRTRLMVCALALAHVAKPLGRERLKLSEGLKGNGMCFAREVVARVPWSGESVTEDIEYTLRLCRAGYRVAFLPDAAVWAQMPTTGAQSVTQRQRWEGGRYRLIFSEAPRLLMESIRKGSRILGDRAMELLIPPFAELFAVPALLGAVSGLVALATGWPWARWMAVAWGALLLLLAAYLATGLWVARVPGSIAVSLLYAPFYIVWKFGVYAVMLLGRSAKGWRRTERHGI